MKVGDYFNVHKLLNNSKEGIENVLDLFEDELDEEVNKDLKLAWRHLNIAIFLIMEQKIKKE